MAHQEDEFQLFYLLIWLIFLCLKYFLSFLYKNRPRAPINNKHPRAGFRCATLSLSKHCCVDLCNRLHFRDNGMRFDNGSLPEPATILTNFTGQLIGPILPIQTLLELNISFIKLLSRTCYLVSKKSQTSIAASLTDWYTESFFIR